MVRKSCSIHRAGAAKKNGGSRPPSGHLRGGGGLCVEKGHEVSQNDQKTGFSQLDPLDVVSIHNMTWASCSVRRARAAGKISWGFQTTLWLYSPSRRGGQFIEGFGPPPDQLLKKCLKYPRNGQKTGAFYLSGVRKVFHPPIRKDGKKWEGGHDHHPATYGGITCRKWPIMTYKSRFNPLVWSFYIPPHGSEKLVPCISSLRKVLVKSLKLTLKGPNKRALERRSLESM